MSYLEQALKDLEIATAALAKMPVQDVDGVQAILARRSRAIERLAELKDAVLALPLDQQAQIVQRMRYASGGGELAELRLAQEEHRYSIRHSAVMARGYEVALSSGTKRLARYYAGGLKPDKIAQLIYTAATVAIPAVIAGK